jgi:hypothetical protein
MEALTYRIESIFCVVQCGVSSELKNDLLDYAKMRQREIFTSQELRQRLATFNSTGMLATSDAEITFGARYSCGNSQPRQESTTESM